MQAKWSLDLTKFLSSYLNVVVMRIMGRGHIGVREDVRQSLVGEVSQNTFCTESDLYHIFSLDRKC